MQTRFLTVLPVFNEESHIVDVLDQVRRYSPEILVVDDGSTDCTSQILADQTEIQIITHEKNIGYGAALRSSFEYAVAKGFDVLVTIDCDGQHEPRLIQQAVTQVFPNNGEPVDIVSGSRYLKQFGGDSVPPEDRRRINMQITERLHRELKLKITDAFCGFKAYRTAVIENFTITELGYAMPLQVWVQAVRLGLRIVEFPVPLIYLEEIRSFGVSLDDCSRRMAYYQQVLDREMSTIPETSVQTSGLPKDDITELCCFAAQH